MVWWRNKHHQSISIFFVISFNAFWKFLRFKNLSWDFLVLTFCPGIFVQVLLEALGICFGFDFCPHLIIPVTWIPEYPPPPPPSSPGHVLVRTLGLSLWNDHIIIWKTGNFTVDNKPIMEAQLGGKQDWHFLWYKRYCVKNHFIY